MLSVTLSAGILLSVFLCYPMFGDVMCLILILGSASSIRKPLLAPLSLSDAPDGPTDGHSGVLSVHRLSRQPARHASVYHLPRPGSPKFVFYLPVNHKFIVISHMTNKTHERGMCAMKLSRCLTFPARHTTASNGSYFVLRVLLQMLVSVGEMWSMSGALTASGESPSHGSYCLEWCRVRSPLLPPAPLWTVGIHREGLER